MVIESAIGGANITTTIEGRERFPVNVRYQRSYRSDVNALKRTLIATPGGAQIPIEQVADISLTHRAHGDPHRAGAARSATSTWTWPTATSAATSRTPSASSARW